MCGIGAQCQQIGNRVQCACPAGYTGNAYVDCRDIDECLQNPCGGNSVCINTAGGYDCKCQRGFFGNPFAMCSPIENDCDDPLNCVCGNNAACPPGYRCDGGRCLNLCDGVTCGPGAACSLGKCVCPSGHTGAANDFEKGCFLRGQCDIDQDCKHNEICFQFGRGSRNCVDGCSKFSCGPNALCVSSNHRSSCICSEGYAGNPNDFNIGCQSVSERVKAPDTCDSMGDCQVGQICMVNSNGLKECVNPCSSIACGANEECRLDANSNPACHCKSSYVWNPALSLCEKPSIPDCTSDIDCHQVASCQPDALGILKCTSVCDRFQCPANSVCVASNHHGECQCLPGYAGNPNERNGCRLERLNQCLTTVECAENEKCKRIEPSGLLECRSACEDIQCGPGAVCVTNNHIAKCQCPPGKFDGDPYNITSGCKSVPCVYNDDCPMTQLCNRLTHTCYDICDGSACGENAICITENRAVICQCPPGYKADPIPEAGCKLLDACSHCAESSICELTANGHICKCPDGYTGFPESTGCFPIGQCPHGDNDCPDSAKCVNGRCVDKCHDVCGPNMLCTIKNGEAVCACPSKFKFVSGFAKDGCVRDAFACNSDYDCANGICSLGQCTAACRDQNDCANGEYCLNNKCTIKCSSHSQCPDGQACRQGVCSIGCRGDKDCSGNLACYDNSCQSPCDQNICGPNALCKIDRHLAKCECPAGFEGNPTPDQGCVRVPSACVSTNRCPNGHMCIANTCQVPCSDSVSCAIGERCDNNVCAKVCYTNNNCLPGEICNERGTCQTGCLTETDCPPTQVCQNGKCKCGHGFIGTPFGCTDIDECSDQVCHKSALCENTPGSFKCACPEGTVGDAYTSPGCLKPNQCTRNEDCARNLACLEGKCTEVCSIAECGINAICQANEHKAYCQCPPGHLGDPTDKANGCFRVECISSDDCDSSRFCNPQINKCQSKSDFSLSLFYYKTTLSYLNSTTTIFANKIY